MSIDRHSRPGEGWAPSKKPARTWRLLRLGVLGLAILAVLFGACEIVERAWLAEADIRLLRLLHLARGIGASLIASVLVGWSVLKTSRSLLPAASSDEEWPGWLECSEKEKIEHYSRWFISMRWLAALAALTLSFIAVKLMGFLPEEAWWPLLASIAALAGANLLFFLLTRRGLELRRLLELQVYVDLLILMAFLHFSGGIENPLAFLTFFHVIISGILMGRGQCYRVAAAASFLLGLMAAGEWSGLLKPYVWRILPWGRDEIQSPGSSALYLASWTGLQCFFLFLCAYFVTTVADWARSSERRLKSMADQALAEGRLLEQALETTGAGLRVVGRDLKNRLFSRRWREWFLPGGSPDSPFDREELHVRQTLEDGKVRILEAVLPAGEDGLRGASPSSPPQRVFQVTTAPLLDRDGKVTEAVQLAQDITLQKQAQRQVLKAGRLAAVGELAGHIAHEVNNPLSIIGGKGRLLLSDRRGEMSEKVATEIEKIVGCSDRVARLAQGLLSCSRPTGTRRLPLDIRAPLRKARALIEDRARTARVQIEERFSDPLPFLKANEGELEQVFLNLFLNALDAMPDGGKLSVAAAQNEAAPRDGRPCVEVAVEDSGIGIPEADQERIFEPFFSTKGEGKGTGLGLSICLGLVKGHGGEIEVRSDPGRGSRFTIKLPAEPICGKASQREGQSAGG